MNNLAEVGLLKRYVVESAFDGLTKSTIMNELKIGRADMERRLRSVAKFACGMVIQKVAEAFVPAYAGGLVKYEFLDQKVTEDSSRMVQESGDARAMSPPKHNIL
ncbi:unnamed protein product [Calypogeia fissa]